MTRTTKPPPHCIIRRVDVVEGIFKDILKEVEDEYGERSMVDYLLRCAVRLAGNFADDTTVIHVQNTNSKHANEHELQGILDTSHPEHAPDLAAAIQLWYSLYGSEEKTEHSHTRGAELFLEKMSLPNTAKERIREIATPRKYWKKQRSDAYLAAQEGLPPVK